MTEIAIGDLIALLSRNPGWRFFDKYGSEYTYDIGKAVFEHHGWDHYNDCPDTRIRNLRTPRKLMKSVGSEYMYVRAAIDGEILRLWTRFEEGLPYDPEMTLRATGSVNIERECGRGRLPEGWLDAGASAGAGIGDMLGGIARRISVPGFCGACNVVYGANLLALQNGPSPVTWSAGTESTVASLRFRAL